MESETERRLRKFSSSTLETVTSWEDGALATSWDLETVASSHDSGFSSIKLSCLKEENVYPGLGGDLWRRNVSKPDLLDNLVLEDMEERLRQMKMEGSSSSEVNYIENLLKLLDLQSLQSQSSEEEVEVVGEGEIVPVEMFWSQPETGGPGEEVEGGQSLMGGVHTSLGISFPSQVISLNSFLEQEVPLAFPGQILPASPVQSQFQGRAISVQSARKLPVQKSRVGQVHCSPGTVVVARLSEAASLLQDLARERSECQKLLVQQGLAVSSSEQDVWKSDNVRLGKLLGEVREEHERILALVRRMEFVTSLGLRKSLYCSLAKWQTVARNLGNMTRSSSETDLAAEILRMGLSMRRLRTLLWAVTSALSF